MRKNRLLIHNCTIRYIYRMEPTNTGKLSGMVERTKIRIYR
jgi:hypothetical protein